MKLPVTTFKLRYLILLILVSPLAYAAANRILNATQINNGSGSIGIPSSTNVTATEVSRISGVISNVQTQLDAKEGAVSAGTTAQYYRGDKTFQTLDTSIVPENTNLYYTQGRFDTAFTAKSTSNLSEGSNLYFTNARAQGAVSASAPLVDTVGVFSIPAATSSVNGYLSSTDWSTFNGKADLASPAFTGVPTGPTAGVGTSTTQLATTAFVLSQGFQGATGSMPSATSSTLATTTSASTTFVTAITTSITVTASSAPVLAKCVLDMTSATSASVANERITVNAVASGTVSESITTATTQHLTVPNHYLSASLGPGTYTVNCDFARASGTGTVTIAQGTLTAVALQGTESNGITQLTGLGLSAGPGSGLQSITGTLSLAGGGTNASLTAANGAIPYSTASALALLAPGTAGQVVRSGGAGAPTWTSETFPASTTINQLLYSSAANVVSGLATANTGALVTSSTGVPSITSGATANRLLRTNGTTVSFAQVNLTTDVTATLPFAQGGTGATAFANQRIPFSNGTNFITDANFIYDTTNARLNVGGSGTAHGNFINTGSSVALQAYNSGTNNAFQALNQSAFSIDMVSRQNNNNTGASLGCEFGRGTLAAPLQALNGDQLCVWTVQAYTGTQTAPGYAGAMAWVATEDVTNTANGSDFVLATTPNTTLVPLEHLRVKQSGEVQLKDSHLKSTQTVAPTALVSANAGTGATCTLSNSTDTAGQVSITTGTLGISTGDYCDVTFNKAYAVAPICVLTPASSTLSTSVYVTSSTTLMSVNFAVAGGISATYALNYHCIETQ